MVKINLKIEKKDLWLLSAIVVFLIGVGYVIAYNAAGTGGTPSIMGHSIDELEGVQVRITGTCADGSSIRVINANGTVACEPDDSGGTDTRCDTSGTCSQVCIGSDCRFSWPATIPPPAGTTFSVCVAGVMYTSTTWCSCGSATELSKIRAVCSVTSDTGSCSAQCWEPGNYCGSCCVCRS